MSTPKPEVMAISEAELTRMTRDMEDLHNDQCGPALQESVDEWVETIHDDKRAEAGPRRFRNRRLFLLGGGAAASAAVLAACGSSSKKTTTPPSSAATTTPSTGGSTSGSGTLSSADMSIVNVEAQIENLAVFAYTQGLAAATAGKLGTVPPAVATFATTAKAQHVQHAAAFNAVLTAAGGTATQGTDNALTPTVKAMFAKVTNVTGLANLALLLENTAAQTYQNDAATLTDTKAISTAATIMPVEMQHAAILYFVLGKYPGAQSAAGSPIAFSQTTMARPASDATAS